ncbi:MATE family efflux transporter [Halorussus salilacus]|uniref:MATE family efflux transporter n=1 Tax=Halorussus salilacus TaxID=2953750 RepID=UPI00209D95C8|nr:MATE family efflux transporter [Halorussus salilacus]USZ69400.1 MATE family efflux transporter [Halorussus salilacus]
MARFPNPVRLLILSIGLALARVGLVDPKHVRRTTDLAWPRIVTGLARMSKNAVDVAMVGIAVGPVAIAGVGFAAPYWGVAFSLGGGLAGGTIALVSQRYGAEAFDELGRAVRSSVALVVAVTIPVSVAFWALPAELISVMTDDARAIELGATYLRILALGVPFAGLNLIGSRVYIGADDAWTPMLVRAGGALSNIVLSAAFIFGLGLGVAGAAWGTVLANVLVTAAFAVGLVAGRLPGAGALPVTVDPLGSYVHLDTMRDLVRIGLPVVGRNTVWTVAKFPMLAIVGLFGPSVVAAYVIARRIWGLMNTPGWGFGLASSSLVGQALGDGDEPGAESYARDVVAFSVATYAVAAVVVAVFAEPIVHSFVDDPTDPSVPVAIALVYAACLAVVPQGVKSAAAGPLDASGDTRWPFYSQVLGMFGFAIPVAYLGATTPLGLVGLYLSFMAETVVPAAVNYYRFSTGKWKAISREFRPETPVADD